MSTLERLRTTLAALNLAAIDARLEALLESASKKEPAYADFLLRPYVGAGLKEQHFRRSNCQQQRPEQLPVSA